MTKAELAAEYVADLYNAAEMVYRQTQEAREGLIHDNLHRAHKALLLARKWAAQIESPVQDALRAVNEAIDETASKEAP